jgi:hypothetical protein
MYTAALIVLVAFQGHGGFLPSQNPLAYRYGCTPANRHCERCRPGCGGPSYDYRRNFDYPWYPPYHRPMDEDVPYDLGPRIIPLDHLPPGELLPGDVHWEEVPAPGTLPRGVDQSSPSDRPPRSK